MKKKVSESYGWEPTVITQTEQCICCKEDIPARQGEMHYTSTQPRSRSFLCYKCHDSDRGEPLFWHPRYQHEGRISIEEKNHRAARSRELAKGHAVKV